MPVLEVRFDPASGWTKVGRETLTHPELLDLRERIDRVINVERDGYGQVDGDGRPVSWSHRFAEAVLEANAPKAWRPGMRPVYDGGGG